MRKQILTKYIAVGLMASVMITATGCEKNLEVTPDPSKGLLPEVAIKNASDLQSLLNSCYDACANMMDGRFQIMNDLLADDVGRPLNNQNYNAIYNRNSDPFNGSIDDVYKQPYYTVYRVNLMNNYYDKIEISDAEKNRLQGEAAFLRALSHFETVKLWAQPAGYTSDNSHPGIIERTRAANEVVQRSNVASNYNFIISDLQVAINKLPAINGIHAGGNAAKALLAKVYFTMGRYNEALPLLNEVIPQYTLSDSLNRFRRQEVESEIIFGFVTTSSTYDIGSRGAGFKGNYRSDLSKPNMTVSAELNSILNSDTTDLRRLFVREMDQGDGNMIYVSTKFNIENFATPYLTLTDMILMRAEIYALQNNSLAINDLALIVRRAYRGNGAKEASLATLSGPALVDEVRLQRRLEMHLEGDRLPQLKRIGVSRGRGNLSVRNKPWDCNGMILQFPSSSGTVKGFVFNPTTTCD